MALQLMKIKAGVVKDITNYSAGKNGPFWIDSNLVRFINGYAEKITYVKINDVEVWAQRISYVGELGFELYVKKEKALKLFDILMDKGKTYNRKDEPNFPTYKRGENRTSVTRQRLPIYFRD